MPSYKETLDHHDWLVRNMESAKERVWSKQNDLSERERVLDRIRNQLEDAERSRYRSEICRLKDAKEAEKSQIRDIKADVKRYQSDVEYWFNKVEEAQRELARYRQAQSI
jgi:chromosome segregation ATPase